MPTRGARDHEPDVIEDFGGWWQRGDPETCTPDHFLQADNVQYIQSGVESRDGLINYLINPLPTFKTKRVYNYITQTGDTLIILTDGGIDGPSGLPIGNIYHITGPSGSAITPILTIIGMEDFGFVAINGRAYITPFKTYINSQGEKYQLGLKNEFLYVYKGDGSLARKAGGLPPVGSGFTAALGPAGVTDEGLHLLAVVYETDTGYLTAFGPTVFASLVFSGTNKITLTGIPVAPAGAHVIKRHIVSTKAILDYNGDQLGYQFFFIPGGIIPDNTTTTLTGQYFDSDLISDASHLIDNFSEIPASVNLNTYHSRLVMVGEYGLDGPPTTVEDTLEGLPAGITDNRSIARLSYPGEPESISKIDGLIVAPLDGQALTNVQEFRDVLYLFKHTRTFAYSDNGDEPVTWQEHVLDQGIGAPVHGIATVLDTGGVNIDFLFIVDWSGLMLFNGTYAQPGLSWKIEDFWKILDRNEFHAIQIVNDTINKKIWITLPTTYNKMLLHANYANGMDSNSIRWARWIFDVQVPTIALIETDRLIIGTPGV